MSITVRAIRWQGWDAWALECADLRVVTVPALGAKLVSLLDKRSGREWLAGPGDRPLQPIPYGARFQEQDMSGWDEMFPTISACAYPGPGEAHGAALPDHGEVWSLPWQVEESSAGRLTLAVQGRALPYRLTRTLTCRAPDTLDMRYQLTNLSHYALPYIWAAHPQLACGAGAEIHFPPEVTAVYNTLPASWGWGEVETRFDWPVAAGADGRPLRLDRVGPATLRRGRKLFAPPDTRPAWAAVVCQPAGDWLHLAWDAARIPYLGLWVDEGALNQAPVAAPEPTTGFYDSLAVAWAKQAVTVVEAGATRTWSLRVRLGAGELPLSARIERG